MSDARRVVWSGEGPAMTLMGADRALVLLRFFRVVLSPYGRGHVLVLLEGPYLDRSLPDALNVCVTDNVPLAEWLVAEFVAPTETFRGIPALEAMEYRPLAGVAASGDHRSAHVEWVKGDGVEATLAWEDLGEPWLLDLAPEQSPTGRHRVVGVRVDARRVRATVNRRPLPGRTVAQDLAGRTASSAFLAYSETWLS